MIDIGLARLPDAGSLGEPLPGEEQVFRLCFPTSNGRVSPAAFELSSADKHHSPARLSIFAISRTTPIQAWTIANRNPRFVAAARLQVASMRTITLGRMRSDSNLLTQGGIQYRQIWRALPDMRLLSDLTKELSLNDTA